MDLKQIINTHTHTHTHIRIQIIILLPLTFTWQSQHACALSRHYVPCKQSSWSWARNMQENRLFRSKWWGHLKSNLDHYCCFMRKGLEFVPQQMSAQSGRKTRWKIAWVGLKFRISGLEPRTHMHACTHARAHIHTHTHTHTHRERERYLLV